MLASSFARVVRRAVTLEQPTRPVDEAPLLPTSVRAFDPGVALALGEGYFALPTGMFRLSAHDPFDAPGVPETILRDLASFAWLRHLDGAPTAASEAMARRLLLAWPQSTLAGSAIAREPIVSARRAASLLAHADAGLAGADRKAFDAIASLIVREFDTLARQWPRWPLGHARVTAAIALVAHHLSRNEERARALWERRLIAELDRQVLPDGGHISRNPAVGLDIALDLLPLRRLYAAARVQAPAALPETLTRLHRMLRFLQHTDHQLARFNGMGATPAADLAAVLLHLHPLAETRGPTGGLAAQTGYARCDAGASVLLVDLGTQTDCLPGHAPFAGALSFEFSSARAPIFANAGAEAAGVGAASPACRTTAAHSALVVADTPSAPLGGGCTGVIEATLTPRETAQDPHVLVGRSTCYRERFGLTHERTLTLAADGLRLTGQDVLQPRDPAAVPDHPFAIHLHLHPSVYVDLEPAGVGIRLTTADGARWRVTATGAAASIEAATYHASTSGPRPTLQIVFAGRTSATREVTWTIERIEPPTVVIATT